MIFQRDRNNNHSAANKSKIFDSNIKIFRHFLLFFWSVNVICGLYTILPFRITFSRFTVPLSYEQKKEIPKNFHHFGNASNDKSALVCSCPQDKQPAMAAQKKVKEEMWSYHERRETSSWHNESVCRENSEEKTQLEVFWTFFFPLLHNFYDSVFFPSQSRMNKKCCLGKYYILFVFFHGTTKISLTAIFFSFPLEVALICTIFATRIRKKKG